MSPEQLTGEKISENTDVFSLGCVLYELLTGAQAFGGKDYPEIMRKVVRDDPPKPSTILPDLPPILDDILARALAKNPQDRYLSCLDMGFDLRVALRGMKKDDIPERKPKQALEYLQYIPFFNDFTPKQIEQLYLASDIDKAKKDSVIITEGDIDDTFYIVLSGTVRIEKAGKVIAKVGVGECFGEMAYIGGQARTATVKADTDCLLMRISATLLDRAPGPIQLLFFKNFSRFLVERFSLLFKKPSK
jgi:serine/threonine-protein kinase